MRVTNPSVYPRTEIVRWGRTGRSTGSVLHLPRHEIVAARVTVDGGSTATVVAPTSAEPSPYVIHPLAALLAQPGIRFDDKPPQLLALVGEVLSHPLLRAWHYRGWVERDPKTHLVVDLLLYIGSGEPWASYQIRVGPDSLTEPQVACKITLDFLVPPDRKTRVVDRRGIPWQKGLDVERLWHGSRITSWGVVLPIPREADALTSEQLVTMSALSESELAIIPEDSTHGVFGAKTESILDDEAASLYGSDVQRRGPVDDRANAVGPMLGKFPPGAGWQPFGTWNAVEAQHDRRLQPAVKLGAACEALRPCHFVELDGAPLDIVRHIVEDKLVLWRGQPHWHAGVSPYRINQTHDWAGNRDDGSHWRCFGDQHVDVGLLLADVLLYGSLMSSIEMIDQVIVGYIGMHTLPSSFPQHATSGRNTGRARGRWEQAVVASWLATGSRDAVERAAARFLEVELPFLWQPFMPSQPSSGETAGPIYGDSFIEPHVHYLATPSLRSWEDAIRATGLRALHMALQHQAFAGFTYQGKTRDQIVALIEAALRRYIESVVLYGFHPDTLEGAWAIDWSDQGKTWDFNNPARWAQADHGITMWMYPCAEIAVSMGGFSNEVVAKANRIIAKHRSRELGSWQGRLMLGAV